MFAVVSELRELLLDLPSLAPDKPIVRWTVLVITAAAALGLLLLATVHAPWGRAAAWAICLLIAFVGWGDLIDRLLGDRTRTPWAVRAVWGIAAILAVGGVLAGLHLAFRPVLLAQVSAGLLLAAYFHLTRWTRGAGTDPETLRSSWTSAGWLAPLLVVVSGLAILHFFGHLGSNHFQPSDDGPLYFLLPERLLQTGSFYDPFNVRRLAAYGGQSYLHALYLTVAAPGYLHVLDGGLGFGILAGLLLADGGARPTRRDLECVWLAIVLLATLHHVRTNTASLMTGCAVFLGIYHTLRRFCHTPAPLNPARTSRYAMLIGALVAGAVLLRTSNGIPAAAFAGLALLPRLRDLASGATLRATIRTEVTMGVAAFVVLLPWLWLLRESCGTFMYPLQKGFLTPGFVFVQSQPGLYGFLQSLVVHFFHTRPLSSLPLFALAALLPTQGPDRIVRAASWAALLGFCSVVYAGGLFDQYANSRYYFAAVTSFALIMALSIGRSTIGAEQHTLTVRDMVVIIAVLANLLVARDDVRSYHTFMATMAVRGYRDADADARASASRTSAYRELQARMPAGTTAVMMVDEPYRFDLKRNRMLSLDIGGGMGPSPGYPAFAGPQALRSYLLANRVRYIVYGDFDHSAELYVRASWRNHLSASGSYLQGEAPYMLDTMNSVESLAASHGIVYSAHRINVVDLTRPPTR
jgi:hypothetical protein